MKRTSEILRRATIPAIVLGVSLLVSSPLTHAQTQPCGYGTGHSCSDNGKGNGPSDPPSVPEPGTSAQLAAGLAGIVALAIVARKRLFAGKA